MPVSQAGVASGIASTSRQIGQVLGIAVTGSILAGNLRGGPLRTGFVSASHADWLLLAACGVVIFVLGLVTTSQWALDTAARTAAAFDPAEPRTAVMTRLRAQPIAKPLTLVVRMLRVNAAVLIYATFGAFQRPYSAAAAENSCFAYGQRPVRSGSIMALGAEPTLGRPYRRACYAASPRSRC
jgi:hypothetical protein